MLAFFNSILAYLSAYSGLLSPPPHRVSLTPSSSSPALSTHLFATVDSISFPLSPYTINATIGNESFYMALQLYSSNIFVANCPHFLDFECDQTHCQNLTNTSDLIFPQFSVNGTLMYSSPVSFGGSGGWFQNFVNITSATNCSDVPWPDSTYSGAVGLGVDQGMNLGFESTSSFSIYVDENSEIGELIFGVDWYKKSVNSLAAFSNVSVNWEIPYSNLTFGTQEFALDGNVIFDLNMGYIVVPWDFYKIIISQLKTIGLLCTRDFDGVISVSAKCIFNGKLPSAPTLAINASNVTIAVMPSIYLGDADGNVVDLLIVPSSTTQDYTKVLVNDKYENYVILGMPFLNYYYVEYDFSKLPSNKIVFYQAYDGIFDTPLSFSLGVGGAALGVILICCGCCYFSKRRADKAKKEQARAFLRHKQNFEMDESKFI